MSSILYPGSLRARFIVRAVDSHGFKRRRIGSFGANDLAPEDIFNTVVQIRKQTDKPFAVNRWVSTFDDGGDVLDDASYKAAELFSSLVRETEEVFNTKFV